MGTPALFLDRDGVINENLTAHVRAWADFRFLPGALQALRALTALGLPIVIVTNQAILARQLISQATLDDIHRRMVSRIARAGGVVKDILYCPHDQSNGCLCRKPAPGLLLNAAARHNFELQHSIIIGDAITDILAGQRAGCQTILVRTGRGEAAFRTLRHDKAPHPTAVARDLAATVPIVALWCRELLGRDMVQVESAGQLPFCEGAALHVAD